MKMGERTIFLDIETLPAQSPAALEKAMAEVKAPGQYKKPEAIQAWLAENRESAARDAIAKTSFDPAQGHICTIAWAVNDGKVQSLHANDIFLEGIILEEFFAAIEGYHRTTFVGHYIGGFDLRFILCRAVVLGVKIPRCIPRDPKPWSDTIFDTMTAWAGQKGTISMNNLCEALGLEGKGDGLDGSQVAQAWADGLHDEISLYCQSDVIRTREIWRKFQAVGW
jgi:predicted PolB exonuclease-like 3'-5' exonuclease